MPRKKPFSAKQKKKQLQEKRNRKRTDSPRRGKPYIFKYKDEISDGMKYIIIYNVTVSECYVTQQ